MAGPQIGQMRISWIVANSFANPLVDPATIKNIGSIWGSWQTWRAWQTDNVLCHDFSRAQELLQRQFQLQCNLYVPNVHFIPLKRPKNVNLYEGSFPGEMDNPEEIVAMHLAAPSSDLILLLGYDLSEISIDDRYERHKKVNYMNAFRATVNTYPEVQFVLIDHTKELDKKFQSITNITCDKYETVLELFN